MEKQLIIFSIKFTVNKFWNSKCNCALYIFLIFKFISKWLALHYSNGQLTSVSTVQHSLRWVDLGQILSKILKISTEYFIWKPNSIFLITSFIFYKTFVQFFIFVLHSYPVLFCRSYSIYEIRNRIRAQHLKTRIRIIQTKQNNIFVSFHNFKYRNLSRHLLNFIHIRCKYSYNNICDFFTQIFVQNNDRIRIRVINSPFSLSLIKVML